MARVNEKLNSGINVRLNLKEILLILGILAHAFNTYLVHQRQELLLNEILSVKNEMLKQLPALSTEIKGVVSELDLQNSLQKITSSVKDFRVSKTNLGGLVDQIPSVLKEPSSTYSLFDSINQIVSHPVFVTILGIVAVFYVVSVFTDGISLGVSEVFKPENEVLRQRIIKDNPIVITPNLDKVTSPSIVPLNLQEMKDSVIPLDIAMSANSNCIDFPELSVSSILPDMKDNVIPLDTVMSANSNCLDFPVLSAELLEEINKSILE